MTNYSHGALENEIMNAVWTLEEDSRFNGEISVHEVLDFINKNSTQRAYTTIKTVMDRLAGKEMLIRYKSGKKFCYKASETRSKMANTAINKLLKQYFNNDANLLLKTIEKECIK